MGAINEYLKLIPEGLKNLNGIADSIKNQIKTELGTISDEDLEIIATRRAICEGCPFNSKNAVKLGFYSTERSDDHCIHCGCPITTRTNSLVSNCGIEHYNNKPENANNPMPLKWTKVK